MITLRAKLGPVLNALGRGLRLRCPACGHGGLFARGVRLHATCPYCAARFERSSGESMGAVYINSGLTLALALGGFFALERAVHPPLLVQLAVWIAFTLLFQLLTFRLARGLWIAVAFLTGGVYPDPDYEREWIRPQRRPALWRAPTED